MRYIDHGQGGEAAVLKLQETAAPVILTGEVLIEVYIAGVNRPDVAQRTGTYPPPVGASTILGLEVAGQVIAVADDIAATGAWPQVGDWVCALTPGGAYAELVSTPAQHCLPIPKGFDLLQAAALPENYFTVWFNLFERGGLKAGERVLIHGGTSGIGLTAIQLAKEFGATVYTTVGSEKKQLAAQQAGADLAINYRSEDFVTVIKALTEGQGVQVVLDMVAGDYVDRNLRVLGMDGRLVQIALMQGSRADINVAAIMTKRLVFTGSTLRPQSIEQKARIARQLLQNVWPVLEAGRCKPVIDRVYPLAEAAQAHVYMESGAHIGKIMLQVKTSPF
ncbi:NAD(P)H-quinone oxidoreductase [Ampullimonas aquatilis]|uniref:NAD(P)H-quinone oxidoreductase n=1 Tax=Ampullimonas aquatilis TaxID=1341549 RepID=UPI003C7063C6